MGWVDVGWTIIATGVGGYVLLAALITALQRKLIFKPDPRRITPEAAGLAGVEVWRMPTLDGATLIAWYAKAASGYPTILYFHGNAGYIELRSARIADLNARGFGVLMPSYRSYGGSTGYPCEAALIADAKLAYDRLRDHGVATSDIIAFGESLGTGVATQLAAAKLVAGLVLDSPYTSMADLAAKDYPWLPVPRLLWDQFETIRHIKRVTQPVLVIHGQADQLVPVAMGHAVAAAAVAEATLLTYSGATHLDHLPHGSFDDVERWILQLLARQVRAQTKKPEVAPGLEPKPIVRLG